MNAERSNERPHPKDFGWTVERVDREKMHVYIIDGGREYKWFRFPDGRVVLVNGDEREMSKEKRDAMKLQVRAILGPEISSSE